MRAQKGQATGCRQDVSPWLVVLLVAATQIGAAGAQEVHDVNITVLANVTSENITDAALAQVAESVSSILESEATVRFFCWVRDGEPDVCYDPAAPSEETLEEEQAAQADGRLLWKFVLAVNSSWSGDTVFSRLLLDSSQRKFEEDLAAFPALFVGFTVETDGVLITTVTLSINVGCLCPTVTATLAVDDPTLTVTATGSLTVTTTPTETLTLSTRDPDPVDPVYSFDCCPQEEAEEDDDDDDGEDWLGVPGWLWLVIGLLVGCCLILLVLLLLWFCKGRGGGGGGGGSKAQAKSAPDSVPNQTPKGEPIKALPPPGDALEHQGAYPPVSHSDVAIEMAGKGGFKKPNPMEDEFYGDRAGSVGAQEALETDYMIQTECLAQIEHGKPVPIASLRQVQSPRSAMHPAASRSGSPVAMRAPPASLRSTVNYSNGQSPFSSLPFEYGEPSRNGAPTDRSTRTVSGLI